MEGKDMENAAICNEFETNEMVVQDLVSGAEAIIKSAVDISAETTTIMTMTPKDGYLKKLDLIYSAEDMSTKEKIQAISHAEDKYAQDIERTSELCKGLMWVKAGVIFTICVGSVVALKSPEGQKIVTNALKKIACG